MLSKPEFESLSKRLEKLKCVDEKEADGLFTFVLKGEPESGRERYEGHISHCAFCRVARETYRYKRDVAKNFRSSTT